MKISKLAVARGDIIESVGATGTLQAVKTVQVGSQVSGNIKALYADFNSIVKKGQIVAELDPSLLQTQIEQARANVIRAQADLDRLKVSLDDAKVKLKRTESLAARQLVAPQDLETAQVAVRSAEAQIKSSEASLTQSKASLSQNEVNLQHTVIEAPIDGIVISRNVDVGQTVAASMNAPTLFIIAEDLTKMQVNANVDESDVGRIRAGQIVKFRVDAYPLEEFTGTVSQVRLQPIVTQNVVTYATVIDVPEPAAEAEAGDDGDGHHRDRPAQRRDPRAERGAAVPAERRHVRGAEPGRAARDAARRGRRAPWAARPAPGRQARAAAGASGRRPRARRAAPARRPSTAAPQAGGPARGASRRSHPRRREGNPARPARKEPVRARDRPPSLAGQGGAPGMAQGQRGSGGGQGGFGGGQSTGPRGAAPALPGADGQHVPRRTCAVRGAHARARHRSEQPRRRARRVRARRTRLRRASGAAPGAPAQRAPSGRIGEPRRRADHRSAVRPAARRPKRSGRVWLDANGQLKSVRVQARASPTAPTPNCSPANCSPARSWSRPSSRRHRRRPRRPGHR